MCVITHRTFACKHTHISEPEPCPLAKAPCGSRTFSKIDVPRICNPCVLNTLEDNLKEMEKQRAEQMCFMFGSRGMKEVLEENAKKLSALAVLENRILEFREEVGVVRGRVEGNVFEEVGGGKGKQGRRVEGLNAVGLKLVVNVYK